MKNIIAFFCRTIIWIGMYSITCWMFRNMGNDATIISTAIICGMLAGEIYHIIITTLKININSINQ